MAWELTTWKPPRELTPFKGFESMWKEMHHLWDPFLEDEPARWEGKGEWLPALDLTETKNEFVVKAEVPGINGRDIDISLKDDLLTIRGEKKQEREEKKRDYHLVERGYGFFNRSVALPKEVNGKKITASYKDGMLQIVLPKSKGAKTKEVKVTVE